MPKVQSITYSLENAREVYKPGDTVSGYWTLDLGESFSVRGIRTALIGAAFTRWTAQDPRKDDKISHEKIITQWRTVFGKKLGEDGPNPTISAGVHKYRFSFKLPDNGLPSSYEGKYGAIRYRIQLQIDRPLFRFNVDRFKTITILDDIDVNAPEFCKSVARKAEKKISRALGLGDQGSVSLNVQTDRSGYCPGEKIAITLIANNESEKDLGVIKASFIQRSKYVAADEEKTNDYVLRTVTGTSLQKKSKKSWSNQLLQIDAVPPTTRERTCRIVSVSYFVKVIIDVPLLQGWDVCLYVPVTIGTVPQGLSQPSTTNTSNGNELDLSSTITYTKCNKGFEYFTESGDGFYRIDYNPWCAYVPNFKYEPKSATVPTSQSATAKSTPTTQSTAATRPKTSPSNQAAVANTMPSIQATPSAQAMSAQSYQAPPLPSKTGLPPPMVVVPTVPVNNLYPQINPSAPPMDLVPPSYEEAMEAFPGVTFESPKEEKVPDSNPDSNEKEEPKTIVLLRFSDDYVVEFRTRIQEANEALSLFGGELIALAPQVIVNKGTWPARTSVAVFQFTTKEAASNWFEDFSGKCQTFDLKIDDAISAATRDLYQNEKSTYHLALTEIHADFKSKDWKRYVALARTLLTPLRQEIGGVIIVATRYLNHLQGNWPDKKYLLVLTQWDSVTQIADYKLALKDEKYKEALALRNKLTTNDVNIFFQTEDLSYLETSYSENDTPREDDRHETPWN